MRKDVFVDLCDVIDSVKVYFLYKYNQSDFRRGSDTWDAVIKDMNQLESNYKRENKDLARLYVNIMLGISEYIEKYWEPPEREKK